MHSWVYSPRMGGPSPDGGAEVGVAAPGGGARPATVSRGRVVAWIVAVSVIVGGVVMTAILVSGPRPDATLQRTAYVADADAEAIVRVQTETPEMQIDLTTLRPFEPFGEWQVWSAVNDFGAPCLLAFDSDHFQADCLPEPGDLLLTTWPHDPTEGGQIHFAYRGDIVDVFEYRVAQGN